MRQVPGKHGPDVVNKAAQKIVIGSKGSSGLVHLTKKATSARIRADLKQSGPDGTPLLIYLAVISLKRKGVAMRQKGRRGGATKGNWRVMVRAEARRILAARVRSSGATIAGWLHALKKLQRAAGLSGRTTAGGVLQLEQGSAAESTAKAATAASLLARLENFVDGSGIVSGPAVMQAAVNEATRDNLDYLERKLGAGIRDAVNGTNSANGIR
jgi:hypothetical protein